jgi:hypothetical protein
MGRVIELTGPKSQDLHGMAREFSDALNRAITYTDISGNSGSHARFICEMALEDHSKANEIIQSVLRSCNAQLVDNSETGLKQIFIRQSLVDRKLIEVGRVFGLLNGLSKTPLSESVRREDHVDDFS